MDQIEIDKFAIRFADWLDGLNPSQRTSVWSKTGQQGGLFTMDNERLLEKFKVGEKKLKGSHVDRTRSGGSI